MIYASKKITVLFVLILFSVCVFSLDVVRDNNNEFQSYQLNQDVLDDNSILLTIHLPELNKNFTYHIESIDVEISPSAYIDRRTGLLIVDSTYFSRQGSIYFEQYKWLSDQNKWLLTKVIRGERNDISAEIFTPILRVERVKCCTYLGDNDTYSIQDKNQTNKDIELELADLEFLVKDKNIASILEVINQVTSSEYKEHLDVNNVELLNNVAFYLYDQDDISSAILLEAIVHKFPARAVAKLNLADVYWKLGEETGATRSAIEMYKKYVNEMKALNLQNKIPSRVFNRIA